MSKLSRRQVRRRDFSGRPWDPIRHNKSVMLKKRVRAADLRLRALRRAFVRIGKAASAVAGITSRAYESALAENGGKK